MSHRPPTHLSDAEFARAQRVLPGGVNSPVRAFKGVGGAPRVIVKAQGSTLTDADNNTYLDYVGAWGAAILGHAHPRVVEDVARAAHDGLCFGLASSIETRLAEHILHRVPSLERIRFVNSGTEAVLSALRLARAATRRPLVLKFDGCYHGHADSVLVRPGSGAATLSLPDSPGVTPGASRDTLVARFNDIEHVESIMHDSGDRVAAVIVEPVAGNMGLVPPSSGFLEALRALCDRYSSLLIFDEVMTGFRLHRACAQTLLGVTPDLTTFGKIIGGGLPVGAYAGRAELMDLVAPVGPVYQAGTFSGNHVTMAAGLATLELLDENAYARLEHSASRLAQGLSRSLVHEGVAGVVQRVGSMLTLFLGVTSVRTMDDARLADRGAFATFFHAMLDSGVHLPPSQFEAWFVSLAHSDADIDLTLHAASRALRTLRASHADIPLPSPILGQPTAHAS